MIRSCLVCKASYEASYREWAEAYVPRVCSGRCYSEVLDQEMHLGIAIMPKAKAFPDHLRNADRRSGYERRFEEWLLAAKISYSYEPYSFDLDGLFYVPDYLINYSTFVEVKGRWNAQDKTKLRRFTKAGGHIHVIDEALLKELENDSTVRRPKYFRAIPTNR